MIDHLDIESKIIVAECGEAVMQVRRFGIPPLMGIYQYSFIGEQLMIKFRRAYRGRISILGKFIQRLCKRREAGQDHQPISLHREGHTNQKQ